MQDIADSRLLIVPYVNAAESSEVSPSDAGVLLGFIELAGNYYRD
jgi:hypothetical protein